MIPTSNDTFSRNAPIAVDLFAGAGGFSLGALLAGVDVVAAIEHDRSAASTYRKNLVDSGLTRTRLFEQDILELQPRDFMTDAGLTPGDCGILLGGPPCQGFSAHRIGDAGVEDPRNRLLLRYFEYVRALRPAVFLVENVPGLLWDRHSTFVEDFYETARAAGYAVLEPQTINAKDHGVPQSRRRVIILGYDPARLEPPAWPPPPSHFDPGREAADGLPGWLPASVAFARPAPAGDINDVHMRHSEALTAAFRATPANGGSRRQSGRRLKCHETHDGHSDVYGRIDPAKPAPTMTTACINPSKGRFVHPTEHHGITLRQAARLQTFPDWYMFEGGLMAGGVQVGNAVPVALAKALLTSVAAAVEAPCRFAEPKRGAARRR